MCTMDRVFEWLECPPLGAVAPPDSKAKACNGGASVHKSRDWDALDGDLPEMGSAIAHPTGANLALGDPSVSLNAMGGR